MALALSLTFDVLEQGPIDEVPVAASAGLHHQPFEVIDAVAVAAKFRNRTSTLRGCAGSAPSGTGDELLFAYPRRRPSPRLRGLGLPAPAAQPSRVASGGAVREGAANVASSVRRHRDTGGPPVPDKGAGMPAGRLVMMLRALMPPLFEALGKPLSTADRRDFTARTRFETPEGLDAYGRGMQCHWEEGDPARCEAHFTAAIREEPAVADAHNYLQTS